MKKTAAIMLAAIMTASAVNVSAANRIENIVGSITDEQINILYNDSVIQYSDVKPINTEGRVMIPFRVVLESMGATVEYDDAQRLVTAVKDDTEIKFTLMDDTIYINKNGENSTITMDTPMIIVEDRTLVPIRFMSEALGMQVGWDGDTETVLVMDYDDYFEDLDIPNINKAAELGKNVNYNSENMQFELGLDVVDNDTTVDLSCSGNIAGTYTDDIKYLDMDYAVSSGDEQMDIDCELIVNGKEAYIKTDAIEKIAEKTTDTSLKAAALMFKADTWYKLDMEQLIDMLQIPDTSKNMIKLSLLASQNDSNVDEVLKSSISTEGDAEFIDVIALAAQMDTMEMMDKKFIISEGENGAYTVSVDMSEQDFSDMMSIMTGSNEIDDIMKMSVEADSSFDGSKFSGSANILLSANPSENQNISYTLSLTDSAEYKEDISIPDIPTNAEDRTELVSLVISQMLAQYGAQQ